MKIQFINGVSFRYGGKDYRYDAEEVIHAEHLPESILRRLLEAGTVRSIQKARKPDSEPVTRGNWPLKTPPKEYLRKHPSGPKAELARSIIERGEVSAQDQD